MEAIITLLRQLAALFQDLVAIFSTLNLLS